MPILGDAWIKVYDTQAEDNFSQAGDLYRVMSEYQKVQLAGNIAGGLSQATATVQGACWLSFVRPTPTTGTESGRPWRQRNSEIFQ